MRAKLLLLEDNESINAKQKALLDGIREFSDELTPAKYSALQSLGLLKNKAQQEMLAAFRKFRNKPEILNLLVTKALGKITLEQLYKLNAKWEFPENDIAASIAEKTYNFAATSRDFKFLKLYREAASIINSADSSDEAVRDAKAMMELLDAAYKGDIAAQQNLSHKLDLVDHPMIAELAQNIDEAPLSKKQVVAAVRRQVLVKGLNSLQQEKKVDMMEMAEKRAQIEFPIDPVPAQLALKEILAKNGQEDLTSEERVLLHEYRRFMQYYEDNRRPIELLNMESRNMSMTEADKIELDAYREFAGCDYAVRVAIIDQTATPMSQEYLANKKKLFMFRTLGRDLRAMNLLAKRLMAREARQQGLQPEELNEDENAKLDSKLKFPDNPIAAGLEEKYLLGILGDDELSLLAHYRRYRGVTYIMQLLDEKYAEIKDGKMMNKAHAKQLQTILEAPEAPHNGSIEVEVVF